MLGLYAPFTPSHDFDGVLNPPQPPMGLAIADILHKVFVKIDEAGTPNTLAPLFDFNLYCVLNSTNISIHIMFRIVNRSHILSNNYAICGKTSREVSDCTWILTVSGFYYNSWNILVVSFGT